MSTLFYFYPLPSPRQSQSFPSTIITYVGPSILPSSGYLFFVVTIVQRTEMNESGAKNYSFVVKKVQARVFSEWLPPYHFSHREAKYSHQDPHSRFRAKIPPSLGLCKNSEYYPCQHLCVEIEKQILSFYILIFKVALLRLKSKQKDSPLRNFLGGLSRYKLLHQS